MKSLPREKISLVSDSYRDNGAVGLGGRKAVMEWHGIGPGLSTLTGRSERCVMSHVGRELAE